jgi:uncharacterized protein (DUF433 family)
MGVQFGCGCAGSAFFAVNQQVGRFHLCHGKPTFKGTRIMVWQVLTDVAKGKDWDFIVQRQWGGHISKEAIAEAVRLAGSAWLDNEGRLIVHGNGRRKQRRAA